MPRANKNAERPHLTGRLLSGALAIALCASFAPIGAIPSKTAIAVVGNETQSALAASAEEQQGISVVFTNDVHCAVDASETGMGYARMAGFVDDVEAERGESNVTVVDAGDAVQGAAVGTLTDGEAIVDIMNTVGYDFAVPGNHEFDYGMDQFEKLVSLSDATYLSCNLTDLRTDSLVLAPYALQTYDAQPGDEDEDGVLTVAYVGISTPESLTKSSPTNFQDESGETVYGFCEDTTGEALYDAVQKSVDDARADGADYVVAIGHLGESGITSQWTSKAVIANTSGIDAFIDGHSHETYVEEAGSEAAGQLAAAPGESEATVLSVENETGDTVVLAQTGTKLAGVGELSIDPTAPDGQDVSAKIVPASECTASNADVERAVQRVNEELASELETPVGTSEVDLISEDAETMVYVRWQETNLGDFVADAYRARLGADIALVNGGGVRSSIPAGEITKGQLIDVQPFGNELCLVEVTGQDVLDALELGASELPEASGGFLQVSGLTYQIDLDIPSSVQTDESGAFVEVSGERRVHDVKVGGQDIDPNALYTVASHDYLLLEGGSGMTMFQNGKVLLESVMIDNQALIDFMAEDLGGTVGSEYADPTGQGRIVFAPKANPGEEEGPQAGEEGPEANSPSAGDGQVGNATNAPDNGSGSSTTASSTKLPNTGDQRPTAVVCLGALAAALAWISMRKLRFE